jgi:hypothetical protein
VKAGETWVLGDNRNNSERLARVVRRARRWRAGREPQGTRDVRFGGVFHSSSALRRRDGRKAAPAEGGATPEIVQAIERCLKDRHP